MVEGFTSPKIEGRFFGGGGGGVGVCDKSLYLKEDISQGYVHNHCIECFNFPCTEGTIYKDISHCHNQDLMRGGGSLLIIEVLLVFCGVLVITLVRSIGMTFCLRIGTGLAVRLGKGY